MLKALDKLDRELKRLDKWLPQQAIASEEVKLPSPQPGPQTAFLKTDADIAIYGGSAGGGKSAGLLLDLALESRISNPDYGGVIFRRTYPMIHNEGGLWDESSRWYPLVGATPKESNSEWQFPSGATVRFAHLQHEKNKFDWQGSQLARLGFDELTHFSSTQFFYLLSRARTTIGMKPQIRATCNPDADSWVAELIDWWIDEEGYAIPERSGVIRWFVRVSGDLVWADSEQELRDRYPELIAKSLTFIPSKLSDNKILLEADPSYKANLMALHPVEKARLLEGNWKVRAAAGKFINRGWFPIVETVPESVSKIRFWDFASTEKEVKGPDPDWTVGVKMQRRGHLFDIVDVVRIQADAAEVQRTVVNTAAADGRNCMVGWEIEPGSAGKMMSGRWRELLSGFNCKSPYPNKSKLERATPFAVQAEAGNVSILKAEWNSAFLSVLHAVPDGTHDDDLDAAGGAFNVLNENPAEKSKGRRSRWRG